MHGEGGSIAQQGIGYSGRVATVLPVQYPKKGKYNHLCVEVQCGHGKWVDIT